MLAYRRPSALLALAALAAVLAYPRPSALLALAAFAPVLAYRRPSALLAARLLPSMLAVALPILRPDPPPLEPAVLERYLLVFATAPRRRLAALLALGRGHARSRDGHGMDWLRHAKLSAPAFDAVAIFGVRVVVRGCHKMSKKTIELFFPPPSTR